MKQASWGPRARGSVPDTRLTAIYLHEVDPRKRKDALRHSQDGTVNGEAVGEMDKRADRLLEKRRWILSRGRVS